MATRSIRFDAPAEVCILEHGVRAYPDECCGALLGRAGPDGARFVVEALPLENERETERARRFLVSDEVYLRVEREAQRRGLELLGFYHSHPDHPAAPSSTDLDAALPWFSTVIVSVREGAAREMTSWILAEDRTRFFEETIERNTVSPGGSPDLAGPSRGAV